MTEKRVSVRLGNTGGEGLKAELVGIGQAGRQAFEGIQAAAQPASAGLERMGGSAGQVLGQLDALAQRAQTTAAQLRQAGVATQSVFDRVNAATGVSTGVQRQAADIEAYGAELDRLRAKFNPTFAAIQRYRASLEEVRRAHRVGAISAAEMAQAIQRERQAALSSIAAIKGRTTALTAMTRMNRQTTAAIQQSGFQVGDFAVQVASGQSALVAFTQQGSQLLGVFGGPWGAVFGAALAVVGAIAIAFQGAADDAQTLEERLDDAGDAASDFRSSAITGAEGVRNLIKNYGALDQQLINTIRLQRQLNFETARRKTQEAIDAVAERAQSIPLEIQLEVPTLSTNEESTKGLDRLKERFGLTRAAAIELRDAIDQIGGASAPEETARAVSEINRVFTENEGVARAGSEAFREFVRDVNKAELGLNSTAEAQRELEEELKGKLSLSPEQLTDLANREDEPRGGGRDRAARERERALKREQKAAEALRASYAAFEDGLFPAIRATRELAEAQELVRDAVAQGIIDRERSLEVLAAFTVQQGKALRDQIEQIAAEGDIYREQVVRIREAEAEKLEIVRQSVALRVASEAEGAELEAKIRRQSIEEQREAYRDAIGDQINVFSDFLRENLEMLRRGEATWRSFTATVADLADRLADRLIDGALKRIEDAILDTLAGSGGGGGGALGTVLGIFGSAIGGAAGGGPSIPTSLAFAKGGAFDMAGQIKAFAKGGLFDDGAYIRAFARGDVVSAPTLFDYHGGRGVMGEAGPESIMPLKRMRNGDLGVQAGGQAGSAPTKVGIFDDRRQFESWLTSSQGETTLGIVLTRLGYTRG